MADLVSHTSVFAHHRWRAPDSDFMIGFLEDGTTIKGRAGDGELVPGLTYEFYGRWKEHPEFGSQFEFHQFQQHVPHSRDGVIAYLVHHAVGVGPVIAGELFDAFGGEAVKVLRTQPDLAAQVCPRLPLAKAKQAAVELAAIARLEDAKIELTGLFHGRGFPGTLVGECLKRWGILAVPRIRRDPFCLLVEELPGCGFARCDRLYLDLGLPPERLKRQVICLWHVIREDSSGSTWLDARWMLGRLGELICSAKIESKRAILLGCRAGWLARHRDADGTLYLADAERAKAETDLARHVLALAQGVAEPLGDDNEDELPF